MFGNLSAEDSNTLIILWTTTHGFCLHCPPGAFLSDDCALGPLRFIDIFKGSCNIRIQNKPRRQMQPGRMRGHINIYIIHTDFCILPLRPAEYCQYITCHIFPSNFAETFFHQPIPKLDLRVGVEPTAMTKVFHYK